MKLAVLVFAPALFFAVNFRFPSRVFAQSAIEPDLAPGNGQIEAQTHLGVSTTPFDVRTLREAKGQSFVFLVRARYALSDPVSLELHAPLVLGSVAQPAGSYVDTTAVGNPQVGARHRLFERRSDESALAFSGAMTVGAPLASHGANLMPNRLLAIADGIEGRGHPEWFTPGVLPITPLTTLRWNSEPWHLEAELRVPLFVRVSKADLPSATTNPRALGVASIFATEARWRLSWWFSIAAAAHLFFDVVPAVEHVRRVSRVQDFERLSVHVHFGSEAALIIDLQTAISGELGGSTVGGGLRLGVNLR